MVGGGGSDAMTCNIVDAWIEGWIHQNVGGTTGARFGVYIVGGA